MTRDNAVVGEELAALRNRIAALESELARRSQAEQALSERERQWHLFSLATSNMLWNWSFADDSVERNIAFETAFGYSHEEVLTNIGWWVERLHDDDRERILAEFKKTLDEGRSSCGYEYRFRRRDGSYADITDRVHIIRDADGNGVRALGAMTDITERKRMEQELQKNANLEALGILAGGIAHDFNNILTAVIGNLEVLGMSLDEGSEQHAYAKAAEAAAHRTKDLTSQLMTFSTGGAPARRTMSLKDALVQASDLALSGSTAKAEYDLPDDPMAIHADERQIRQVIQNLVLNADQAMSAPGIVRIGAGHIELPESNSLTLEAGPYVMISILDEGSGIPEELLPSIFDPYVSTKSGGHGLGLAIVHSIVSRHGGRITVDSQADAGTRFRVYLPASKERVPPPLGEVAPAPTGSGRILLMDDNATIHDTVVPMAEVLGYDVVSTYDGREAIRAYESARDAGRPFDAVIMDLTVPGAMGGQEAVKALLRIDPEARVLVASGYSYDPVLADYENYGFVGCIRKPVDIQQLSWSLQHALK